MSDEAVGDKDFEADGNASNSTSGECESVVTNVEVPSEDEITVGNESSCKQSVVSEQVYIEEPIEEFSFEQHSGIIVDVPNICWCTLEYERIVELHSLETISSLKGNVH
jgi:hypothetical protein